MDANYLKHSIGPSLTAAISSLLAHPHPNMIQDPVSHVAKHLLHQDSSLELQASQRKQMALISSMIQRENSRLKQIDDCKKRVKMSLDEAIQKMEARKAEKERLRNEETARKEAAAVEAALESSPVESEDNAVEVSEVQGISKSPSASDLSPELEASAEGEENI
ncbi:hypothetical protein HDU83_008526 [Entophlyctis luteolus]|nr:hypothetical protein HDU82_001194 [Entophlyctis luteolus]KAJ3351893.1 hypothetical protein HDU83_008526 [Entophlyctis luteolus]